MTILLKPASAALAVFVAATVPAQAISRYNSESLTCREAQSIVLSEGAAILRYRSERDPSLTLYDRYVADWRFCEMGEVAEYGWIPTADDPQCAVLHCEPSNFEPFNPFRD